jgi:lipoprotein-anchoring transpeptidase ErfK/SrfK
MRRWVYSVAASFVAALGLVVSASPASPGAPAASGVGLPGSFPAAGFLVGPQVAVRAWPSPAARVIAKVDQFRSDYRQEVVMAVGAVRRGSDGRPWYHVRLQLRPNGTLGWLPARSVSLTPVENRIVVQIGLRRILIYHDGRVVYQAKVAVGAPGRETPPGHFYVTARFIPDDPFLGVFAVETSAYSKLTEWPGGGKVGIHGTSAPQLLGMAVSHGCVRVSNASALMLKRYAALGTPIDITA